MNRRLVPVLLLVAAAIALPGTTTTTKAEEGYTLRIASLAPAGSSWMKVLNAWNKTLKDKTDGKLQLRFYPGGSQGDERDFVRKMRVGQLDGGVVTMEGMFDKEGFKLVGWGDAGKTRLFSMQPITSPNDIKSMRPWAWKDDPIFLEFYKVIGASAVKLGVPEVYPALQTRMVDVISSSALTAVALQWYTRVKYMTAHNSAIIVGGTMMRKDKYDELPDDIKAVFDSTAARAHELLNKVVRRDDQKAYDVVLKKGIVAVEAGDTKAEWDAVDKAVRDKLTGRSFSKSLVAAVIEASKP
ncbi:MAG: TRAP transporter substrate-binding protein DctP [Deltaproteobacteria bacterium]|nr:TRAP transporter substrate-binding protein DctP [Deltaproteobacteria bacterium]